MIPKSYADIDFGQNIPLIVRFHDLLRTTLQKL